MALNPFDLIDQRLQNIEGLLIDLAHNPRPTPTPPDRDQLLNLEEAAEFVRLSAASLYRLCGEKKIPHIKQKGRFLFSTKELLQWAKDGRRKNYKEIAADADKKLADFKAGRKQKVA